MSDTPPTTDPVAQDMSIAPAETEVHPAISAYAAAGNTGQLNSILRAELEKLPPEGVYGVFTSDDHDGGFASAKMKVDTAGEPDSSADDVDHAYHLYSVGENKALKIVTRGAGSTILVLQNPEAPVSGNNGVPNQSEAEIAPVQDHDNVVDSEQSHTRTLAETNAASEGTIVSEGTEGAPHDHSEAMLVSDKDMADPEITDTEAKPVETEADKAHDAAIESDEKTSNSL